MKKSGGQLVSYALEQVGVKYTFGIPGVHNTEIYDELNKSELITPLMVTHECGAAFAADGVSRNSDSIGCIVTVPAAGTTHAMSGIGEAYLDGIPMLIISAGVRTDSGKSYQLHHMDQEKLTAAVVKKYIQPKNHNEIVDCIYEAYKVAMSGTPGPVFVEIPAQMLLFTEEVSELPKFSGLDQNESASIDTISKIAKSLLEAKNPGLYLGWGAKEATKELIDIVEILNSPVTTSLQGISVFPYDHPLHTGAFGFGPSASSASEESFKDCDCLLAVGIRFGELATASYGSNIPENLIHVDINSDVFNKNYPAKITLECDGKIAMEALLVELKKQLTEPRSYDSSLADQIAENKQKYLDTWLSEKNDNIVNPGWFFKHLNEKLNEDAFVVLDDGNHTFLAAELYRCNQSKHLTSPTDFNAMGYGVPATIGTKCMNPNNQVIGIVGDGGFLMTGMELLTATANGLGVIIFVFHDGELGQISQFQATPMNRKTCTVLPDIKIEGFAIATGAYFLEMTNDHEVANVIDQALEISNTGRPVLVDVKIDYSKKTKFTNGVVKTNLSRFPLGQKVRFIGRALKRHVLG